MPGFQPRLPWQSLPNYVATSPPSPVCLSTCTCKKAGEEASSVAHFARLGLPPLASLCLACTPIEHLSTCQGSRTFWPHHCNIATLSTGITSNIHIQANSGLNNNILESKYILFVIGIVIGCSASTSSSFIIRGVVVIVVLNLHYWIGVEVVTICMVFIYIWFFCCRPACLFLFEDTEEEEEKTKERNCDYGTNR